MRGAKRRGNLYQIVVVQNEAARQRREIATPSGLAMTSVLSGRLVQALPYSACTIKSDLSQLRLIDGFLAIINLDLRNYRLGSIKNRLCHTVLY